MYGSTIKINRACRLADVGRYPRSCAEVLAVIPEATIKALASRQLAQLMDAVWRSWQRCKALHERDIVAEGAVWDACRGVMVNLGQPWRPVEAA